MSVRRWLQLGFSRRSANAAMLLLGAVLLALSVLAVWVMLHPHAPADGSKSVESERSAAAAHLSPEQVVRRVAAAYISGRHVPETYAEDLTLIALGDFGRAAQLPDLIALPRTAADARLGSELAAPYEAEPFASLSFERTRVPTDPRVADAYVAQTRRYAREVVRAGDGAISFWRKDRAEVSIDGRRVPLDPANAPLLVDQYQEFAVRLARSAALAHDPALARVAAAQAMIFEQTLRDPANGLWAHARGWYGGPTDLVATKWSRAQGWALRGLVETLAALPQASPEAAQVRQVLLRLATALKRFQGHDGLWHQVVDDPASYAETSGSGMIAGLLAQAVHHGDLPAEPFVAVSTRGWRGLLAKKVSADGTVYGGARDTPPFPGPEPYRHRITPVNDPHAVAGVIMAATGQVLLARQ